MGARDVDALAALLADDATFAMPPHPTWWGGHDAIFGFIASTARPSYAQ